MIWICSDWHFNHDKEFVWKDRGFNSVGEMNNEIVKRHNSVVVEDDDVYVLGDLCMGSDLEANKVLIESLKGKIHIVLGNHDTDNRIKMYESCHNVVEICGYATLLKHKKYRFYLSHYPTNTANYDADEPLKARTINLCGHTHSTDPLCDFKEGDLRYHVEVDGHNCYPVPLDSIIEALQPAHGHHCTCNGNCGENCKCKK